MKSPTESLAIARNVPGAVIGDAKQSPRSSQTASGRVAAVASVSAGAHQPEGARRGGKEAAEVACADRDEDASEVQAAEEDLARQVENRHACPAALRGGRVLGGKHLKMLQDGARGGEQGSLQVGTERRKNDPDRFAQARQRVAVPPESDKRPRRGVLRQGVCTPSRPPPRSRSRPAPELVAGGGRLDQPSDQPAAAKRERWEHVRAAIAPHPGLGRGLVVRLLLRKTPYPSRHPNPPG